MVVGWLCMQVCSFCDGSSDLVIVPRPSIVVSLTLSPLAVQKNEVSARPCVSTVFVGRTTTDDHSLTHSSLAAEDRHYSYRYCVLVLIGLTGTSITLARR
jgi:hypothetical protein